MADDHPSPPLVERANENESSFVIKANEEQKAVQSTCTFCSAKQKRWGLFLFSVLYVPLFAGAFFGWGPLQILLEANGAFSSECEKDDIMNIVTNNATGSPATLLLDDDGHPAVCPDQTAKLLTV